jgi:hypothetical protein
MEGLSSTPVVGEWGNRPAREPLKLQDQVRVLAPQLPVQPTAMGTYVPMAKGPRYGEGEARRAIAASRSWAEALVRLGMCRTGGNYKILRKHAGRWGISTEHFDRYASTRGTGARARTPIEQILVAGSTFSRTHLKERLYAEGLKRPVCELCGQGEVWRGRRMGLILDHVNGVSNDNRLQNIRIVCPNCAATLDTHCGRARRLTRPERRCERCGITFRARYPQQRYCSRACGTRWDRSGRQRPSTRRTVRPPYAQLQREVRALGFSAVGRRYGVTDNAIRKWIRQYERELEADRAVAA